MNDVQVLDAPVAPKVSTDLVIAGALTAEIVYAPGGVERIIAALEAEVRAIKTDAATPAGRDAIASLAYKVSRSKTALDKMGKDLTEQWRKRTSAVNADRKIIETSLDALRDEVRKPVTDFEAAEQARVQGHMDALGAIAAFQFAGADPADPTVADLEARLEHLAFYPSREWQEFAQKAKEVIETEIDKTKEKLAAVKWREHEAAEQERQRVAEETRQRQKAAREQAEHEERIAAEAAERARADAERAAEERRIEAERAAQVDRDRLESQREAAERATREADERAAALAERAERDRVAHHERALASVRGMISDTCSPMNGSDAIVYITTVFDRMEEHSRDWEEFAGVYEELMVEGRKRIDDRLAVVRANEQKRALEREQADAAALEAAAQAERDRIAAEDAQKREDAAKREANIAHQRTVHREILAAMWKAGCIQDEAAGQAIIAAVARKLIPRITITY
jgi:colicin import membrane protein